MSEWKTRLHEALRTLSDTDIDTAAVMQQKNRQRWMCSMLKLSGSMLSRDRITALAEGEQVLDATLRECKLAQSLLTLYSEYRYMADFDSIPDIKHIIRIHSILAMDVRDSAGDSGYRNDTVVSPPTEYRLKNPYITELNFHFPDSSSVPRLMRMCEMEVMSEAHSTDAIDGALRTHNMLLSIWPFEEYSDLTAWAVMCYELFYAGYPLPTPYISREEHLKLSSDFFKTGRTERLKEMLLKNLISECSTK